MAVWGWNDIKSSEDGWNEAAQDETEWSLVSQNLTLVQRIIGVALCMVLIAMIAYFSHVSFPSTP